MLRLQNFSRATVLVAVRRRAANFRRRETGGQANALAIGNHQTTRNSRCPNWPLMSVVSPDFRFIHHIVMHQRR